MNFEVLNIDVRYSNYSINGRDRIIGVIYFKNNENIFIDTGLNQMTLRNHDDIRDLTQEERLKIKEIIKEYLQNAE